MLRRHVLGRLAVAVAAITLAGCAGTHLAHPAQPRNGSRITSAAITWDDSLAASMPVRLHKGAAALGYVPATPALSNRDQTQARARVRAVLATYSDHAVPRLRRALAGEGVRFKNYNVEAQCTPTRSAILSGRLPIRTGNCSVPLPGQGDYGLVGWEYTLGELFSDAGYATGAFGKWHVGDLPMGLYLYRVQADRSRAALDVSLDLFFLAGVGVHGVPLFRHGECFPGERQLMNVN